MLSESIQNYLKAIYRLREDDRRVSTNALAERLDVSPASVTGMIKKLADLKLVEYEPYQGVQLTKGGEKVALEIIRHHRLIELYLTEAMGYPWDRVHAEAEKLEHAISEEFEDRIANILGQPTRDPHGDPIPAKDGTVPAVSRVTLADVTTGGVARIERVRDDDGDVLRRCAELGLRPGSTVVMVENDAEAATLHIAIDQPEGDPLTHALERALGDQIFVR